MRLRWALAALVLSRTLSAGPISLHPDNPHYFLFRGRPTVLVTSGEHYGAVLNRDFNYRVYLDELARHGLNHTRTFAGTYREVPGNFSISRNTLAPEPASFVCPWPRSSTPGAGDGGNKFDLAQFNQEYFSRLREFLTYARKRRVVVELNLFCPFYEDSMWTVNPMNARNNVNGIGAIPRTEALTLKHAPLVQVQEALVRKIVEVLRGFDNLYYELANEPYFGGVTLEWQQHMARVILEAETRLGMRHLISQNIANGSTRVEKPFEEVSIFNFHYSRPPGSVAMNYGLGRPIGNNETGFDGTSDATYRIQGWEFLMAGGALYNNLDYSFVAGHERGDYTYPGTTPGGGSAALRTQLGVLKRFLESMPFPRMKPSTGWIRSGVPGGASVQGLTAEGTAYAAYIHHARILKDAKPRFQLDGAEQRLTLQVDLPAGSWNVSWVSPASGRVEKRDRLRHPGGSVSIESPAYREDVAVKISRQ